MVGENTSSSHLMIRTKENVLSGPFPREELIHRVQNGQLREADEICAGNGYWIFLHERGECRALLGVELPRRQEFHEEQTETGTETELVTATDPIIGRDQLNLKESVREVSATLGASPRPSRPSGQTETLGTFKLLLWAVVVLIGFVLFQVFKITDGF